MSYIGMTGQSLALSAVLMGLSGCTFDPSGVGFPPGDASPVDAISIDAAPPIDNRPTLTWPRETHLPNNRIFVRWNPPSETPPGVSIVSYDVAWNSRSKSSVPFTYTGFDALTAGAYTITVRANYDNATQSEPSEPIIVTVNEALIARYTGNDGTGVVLNDDSGSNLDGILAPGFDIGNAWVSCFLGTCLQYDGVDDFVSLGDAFNFDRATPFTIDAWTNRATLGAGHMLFGRMDFSTASISRGYWLGYESDDRLYFLLRHDNSLNDLIRVRTSAAFPTPLTPQHITFSYDGSATAAGVKILMNGIEQMTEILDDSLSGTTLNGAPARIGAAIANGGDGTSFKNVFQGLIDDVAIYDRALLLPESINNMCAREALNREEKLDNSPLPSPCD